MPLLFQLIAVFTTAPSANPLLALLAVAGMLTVAVSAKNMRKYKRKLRWKLIGMKLRSVFHRKSNDPSNASMIFGGILIACIVFGLVFSWAFAAVLFLIFTGALLAGVSKGR